MFGVWVTALTDPLLRSCLAALATTHGSVPDSGWGRRHGRGGTRGPPAEVRAGHHRDPLETDRPRFEHALPDAPRRYAVEAGFRDVEAPPIADFGFRRFHRLLR